MGQNGYGSVQLPLLGSTVSALWALIAVELGIMVALRRYFRRNHGG